MWETVKVGELGKVVTGKTPPTSRSELFGDEYPFITPSDIDGNCHTVRTQRFLSEAGRDFQKNLLLPEDAVCFVCIGATIGKICMTSRPSFSNQQINSIVVNATPRRHDPWFVYYLLQHEANRIKNTAGGAATPIVNKNAFSNVTVKVPSLEVEERIGTILSSYDSLIENNTRRITILREMAQSLYREWFVHFRFPDHEKVKLVDSQLGKIPEGWKVGRLDDALILQRGFDLPTRERQDGSVPIYASTGVVGTHSTFKVRGPGIVTGRSGSLGSVIYIDEDFWPLNTTLWVKELREVTPLYAFHLLTDLKLGSFNSGAAVPTLNRNDVHGLPVIIPSESALGRFDAVVQPLFALHRTLTARNKSLTACRDMLLPRLVSGELPTGRLEKGPQ